MGWSASKAFIATFLEMLYVKLGCYILSMGSELMFLDIIAYLGYKFVAILSCSLINLVVLRTLTGSPGLFMHVVFIYLSLALGFFLLRSWRYLMLPAEADANTSFGHPMRRRRVYFLFSVAALQIVVSYFLLIT